MSVQTSVYIGKVNGKTKNKKVTAANRTELKKKVFEVKKEIAEGKDVFEKGIFGEWAMKWFNDMTLGLSEGTKNSYIAAINHLNRYFEFTKMRDIKLCDFQKMINQLSVSSPNKYDKSGLSKSYLGKIKKVARSIFNYAIANGVAGVTDFFYCVKIPKTSKQSKRRALTEEEVFRVIEFEHRFQLPAMIMLFTGIRRGEMLPLQWKDINLVKGTLTLSQFVEAYGSGFSLKDYGKSSASIRTIPLPPILIDFLKKYKEEHECSPFSYVTCKVNGRLHTKTSWEKLWKSYMIDMNVRYGYEGQDVSKYDPKGLPMMIDRFTPHYFRHTYATLCFYQKLDLQSAKQYLGHSCIQVTSDIYTDLTRIRTELSDEFIEHLETDFKISA